MLKLGIAVSHQPCVIFLDCTLMNMWNLALTDTSISEHVILFSVHGHNAIKLFNFWFKVVHLLRCMYVTLKHQSPR